MNTADFEREQQQAVANRTPGYALATAIMSAARDLVSERPDLAPRVDPIIQWLRAPDVGTRDYGAALLDKGDTIAKLGKSPPRVLIYWIDGMNEYRCRTVRRKLHPYPEPRPVTFPHYTHTIRYHGATLPVYRDGDPVEWVAFLDDALPDA